MKPSAVATIGTSRAGGRSRRGDRPLHGDPAQVAPDHEEHAAPDGQQRERRRGVLDIERVDELAHRHTTGKQAEGGLTQARKVRSIGQREPIVGLVTFVGRHPPPRSMR